MRRAEQRGRNFGDQILNAVLQLVEDAAHRLHTALQLPGNVHEEALLEARLQLQKGHLLDEDLLVEGGDLQGIIGGDQPRAEGLLPVEPVDLAADHAQAVGRVGNGHLRVLVVDAELQHTGRLEGRVGVEEAGGHSQRRKDRREGGRRVGGEAGAEGQTPAALLQHWTCHAGGRHAGRLDHLWTAAHLRHHHDVAWEC